ncbi:MAG: AMP-binding protein [Gemmatimonadota bacterium]|nr:AMP-binding protein [Gemmatimonadota bacterium]
MALSERIRGSTLASVLGRSATTDPGRTYLHFKDQAFSVGRIESDAESLAAALANLGIQAGDRIALILPPRPEFAVAMFAAAKLGAVAVPLNPRASTVDLQYTLRQSGASCAVTIERAFGLDYLEIFEDLMPQLPELQYVVTVGEEDLWYDDRIFQYEDLISAGAGRDYEPVDEPRARARDTFALVYTSGTMGKPKGVELSHENLLSAAAGTAEGLGLAREDKVLGVSALFHVFGLGPGLLSTLLAGASLVLQEDGDPGATLDDVERFAATVHYGIPTLFVAEIEEQRLRPRDLSSLRLALMAGAPVGDELVDALEETFGVTVLTAYTMTEAASTVTMTVPGDPEDKRRFTVGKALAGTEVRILGPDEGDLPVESVGEIRIKGPGVMRGYYRQPRETATVYDDEGYLLSGDLGILDEDGYLHLVGRSKDVIIRSSFNVYPREVEARIESHPAVREVAVLGVADSLLGEAICACIVPVEGAIVSEPEILDWCRETLAEARVPDFVQFWDELPRTDTGKLRRGDLTRRINTERQSS